ncbi:MAG: Clp protease N-terminal domain-containing protein [Fuerstiella sp.]
MTTVHRLEKRFTDNARNVMRAAEAESVFLQHGFVGTEHVLLALVANDSIPQEFFRQKGVTVFSTRQQLERIRPSKVWPHGDWQPQSPGVKLLYDYALEESRNRNDEFVRTEHLILAICRSPECFAFRLLQRLGVDPNSLGQEVNATIAASE